MSQYQQQPFRQDPYQQREGQLQPAPQQQRHAVKFYKTWFFFASLAGKLERDLPAMEREGWRLQSVTKLGMNLFLRRVIVTIWTR